MPKLLITDDDLHLRKLVRTYAAKCKRVYTVEEHSVIGGLGSAVAETLVRRYPVRQEFVGIQDTFGESGSSADLLKKYGLTAADIVAAAHKARET